MNEDASVKLSEISELANVVIAAHEGQVSTHYESCWKDHAGCLAGIIRDVLEG